MRLRRRGFRQDDSAYGAMHVMEAIIVVGFVVSAIVVVTDVQTSTAFRREHAQAPRIDEGHLSSWVEAYLDMDPTNKSVRFGSALEQWMVESLQGNDRSLFNKVSAGLGVGVESQGWISTHYDELLVYGDYHPPLQKKTSYSTDYIPGWGFTLAQPGLSHYNPGQSIDVELLPLNAEGIIFPDGMAYEVLVTGTGSVTEDPLWARAGDTYTIRQWGNNTARVAFVDGSDVVVTYATPSDLVLVETNMTWTVRAKFTAINASSSKAFLGPGDLWTLRLPPGWSLDALSEDTKWVQMETPFASNVTFHYTGASLATDETGWLNVTLKRSVATADPRLSVLSLEQEVWEGGRYHFFLLDNDADEAMGLQVLVSRPNHSLNDSVNPWQLHLANMRGESFLVENLSVTFETDPDLFGALSQGWVKWGHKTTTLSYTGPLSISGESIRTLPLDIQFVEIEPYSPYRAAHPSLLRGETHYASVPSGTIGMHKAWLPARVGDVGAQVFSVPDIENIPGGTGTYTVLPTSNTLIEDLQGVRDTMRLDVSPRVHKPDQTVDITVDTGALLETLRASEYVESNHINLTVEVYNALGHLIGEPHTSATYQMGLKQGPAVRGMLYTDVGGDATADLLVAFGDGNLIALDGSDLPDTVLWQEDLGDDITSGPLIEDWDGDGDGEILVTVTKGLDADLVVLDRAGNEELRVELLGPAYKTIKWTCAGETGIATFAHVLEGDATPANLKDRYGEETPVVTPVQGANPTLMTWRYSAGINVGEEYPSVLVVGLHQGKFAPDGDCDLVYGFNTGRIYRADGVSLAKVWWREGTGDLTGLWVGDTHTTTKESATGTTGDEVLAAWTGTGFMVLEANDPMVGADWETPSGVVMDPTDELIGLSWVNEEVGYLASKKGFVWKTEDGGENFAPFPTAVPITDGDRELVDFTAGSNGNLLFVDSERWMRSYYQGTLGFWEPIDPLLYLIGYTELPEGPGVLTQRDDKIEVAYWNFGNSRPADEAEWSILCTCDVANGNANGLVGTDGATIFWDSIGGSGSEAMVAESVSMAPDATIGTLNDHNLTSTRDFSAMFLDSLRPAAPEKSGQRSLESANLIVERVLMRITGEEAAGITIEQNFTGVSTGPGPAMVFAGSRLLPLQFGEEVQPVLPWVKLPTLAFAPIMVDLDDSHPMLIAVDTDQWIHIYNATTGLPMHAMDLELLPDRDVGIARAIAVPDAADVIWLETKAAVSATVDNPNNLQRVSSTLGTPLPSTEPANWHRLDAKTGTILCAARQDGLLPGTTTKGLALDRAGSIVIGSDLGVLSQVNAGSCSPRWQSTPVSLGRIHDFSLTAPGDAMIGPQLVKVNARFDLTDIDGVELRLVAHTTMSETGRDIQLLVYGLHWTAWDPLD